MPISIHRASIFADGLDHPECLAVHPDGSIYAGGEAGQIYRVSADGKQIEEIANTGGFILGVAISPDAKWLAACDLKKQCVWRLDLRSRTLTEFAGAAGAVEENNLALLWCRDFDFDLVLWLGVIQAEPTRDLRDSL